MYKVIFPIEYYKGAASWRSTMNSANLVEPKKHGNLSFPAAYYLVNPLHPEYIGSVHWHKEYEILWIHSGSMETSIDGQDIHSGPGDLLFVPCGSLHINHPADCTYDCLIFNFELLLNNFDGVSKHLLPITNNTKSVEYNISSTQYELENIMNEIRHAMTEQPPAYELLVVSSLLKLFNKLYDKELISPVNPKKIRENLALDRLKDVLEYIDLNIDEKITLSKMADVAGLSPKYFCQYFSSVMKSSPMQYLNEKRISYAQRLLLEPDCSVTDAAYTVGFSDVGHFIKLFKRYTGLTPKAYARISGTSQK